MQGQAGESLSDLVRSHSVWIGLNAFFAFLFVDPLAFARSEVVRGVGTGYVANTNSLLVVFGTDCSGLHADLRAARNLAFDERLETNR